jgi:uncharacterized protein (TIGR02117 family)
MPRRHLLAGMGAAALAGAAGCAGVESTAPGDGAAYVGGDRTVFVVSRGWHTGVVFPKSALGPGHLPEAAAFPDAHYLEAGWGDRAYYPDPEAGWGDALRAALVPSPAVLELIGRVETPRAGTDHRVWSVPVTADGLARLVAAVHETVDRPPGGGVAETVPTTLPRSRFHPAHGRFHMLNTCNTWVARMLAAAGVPINPEGISRAEDLIEALARVPGVWAL